MKKLVVYYSFDGNTRFVARTMAEAVGADLLEIKPKKEPPHSAMKFFWGVIQVMMKETPELLPLDKDPQGYDILFLGTPVWAWTYAPALAGFFKQVSLKGKKVAVFCCSGGSKGRTLEKMKEHLAGNEVIGETDFVDPLVRNQKDNAAKARKWARDIDGSLNSTRTGPGPVSVLDEKERDK